ncbi:hypothetical protein ES708_17703 [subsurface metagenome]
MLKVRLNCPVCGQLILAKSLEGHLEKVHELTGAVTLRLHPVSPYQHEPEAEVVELAPPPEGEEKGKGKEAVPATTSEPKAETEPEPEPEPEPEVEPED